MPALSFISSSTNTSPSNSSANATLQVVCAFPVSSNYGPGSRILYYVLVAACVTFRKAEWLRNTCLAAVLILPAISALHGIMLASVHTNGVVDLDIFGVFQFCAIGILAAPLTVRLSRSYFYAPGRNIIFLWTILILMGLLALCVEFYRVTPTDCSSDNSGNPVSRSAFPYQHATCGLRCSEDKGPFSPLRGGSANNLDVIPEPHILTFNASMLLAAGFCIPAILSLVFTWDKILETNWKRRRHVEQLDDRIEGANITVREMKGINDVVRLFLSVVEIPLFGGIILTIIGVGEANFFTPQLMYMTEPMASLGQWSPIAGTCLAALGSLYILWSTSGDDAHMAKQTAQFENSDSSRRSRSSERNLSPGPPPAMKYTQRGNRTGNALGIRCESPNEIELIPTITHPESNHDHEGKNSQDHQEILPTAGRHIVRKWLTAAANRLGDAAHERLDHDHDRSGGAMRGFPEIPGENLRNPNLEQVSRTYSQRREERASSTCSASIMSTSGIEGNSPRPSSHESPRLDTSPTGRPNRRDTLEVPKEVHARRRSESH
ncbi:hypothetical protein BDW02DRAFT_582165 [Decorospora gaudefroyi]|uniref:Uncharacterized protein n=1 Tax=Decorospora gaudefroyi TaxID=184978 RepID=A0A6A5K8K9_9PLEO|nr:hypothetical protein BDW02DRAFT_582165 [Decorospora gaudefroyi]